MAAGLSVDLDRWRQEFDELMLVGGRPVRPGGAAAADGVVRAGPAGRAAAGELLVDRRARGRPLPAGNAAAAVGGGVG